MRRRRRVHALVYCNSIQKESASCCSLVRLHALLEKHVHTFRPGRQRAMIYFPIVCAAPAPTASTDVLATTGCSSTRRNHHLERVGAKAWRIARPHNSNVGITCPSIKRSERTNYITSPFFPPPFHPPIDPNNTQQPEELLLSTSYFIRAIL